MTMPAVSSRFGNPFPGLRPFDEDDAHLFFGRETQVRDLLSRMADERFIAVVGLSGSGKSSLVRAGLIPALRRGQLAGAGVRWRVAVMRPGDDPFESLAAVLNDSSALGPSDTREATLRASSFGLLHAGKDGRKADQNLLVVVDQFEEIFRLRGNVGAPWSSAVDFVSVLLAAARDFRPEFATWVVLTMRSDYLGDCAQFAGLPQALNRGQYLVPRLAEDDWYRALRKPAEQVGTPLDEQLLQQLMADAGDAPDQLPVLQHLLMRMWELREGERITLDAYEKAGGWTGALNQHLDEILKPFDAAKRATAKRVWQALTEMGEGSRDSRRPTRVSELMAIAEGSLAEIAAVIEPFRPEGRNFLIADDAPLREDSVVDISHESLIRRWNVLVTWAKQERQWRTTYKAVEAEALSTYPEHWKGAKLDAALEHRRAGQWSEAWARRYAHGDTDDERRASYATATAFLDTSRDAQEAARIEADIERRWLSGWSYIPLAVAAALFLVLQPYVANYRWPFSIILNLATSAGDAWRQRLLDANWIPHLLAGTPASVVYMVLAPYARNTFGRVARARIEQVSAVTGAPLRTGLQTPGSAAVDLQSATYATFGRRAAASLIDWVLLLLLQLPVSVLITLGMVTSQVDSTAQNVAPYLPTLVQIVIFLVYHVVSWTSKHQATFGMRICRIFLTDLAGEPVSRLRAAWRFFARFLSYYTAGFGFLMLLWSKSHQTLHDRLSGTIVLRRPPA